MPAGANTPDAATATDVSRLDASAAGLSGLCLAHCISSPFAALLPLAGVLPGEDWVHAFFFVIAAPVTLMAVFAPFGGTRAPAWLLSTAIAGVALLGLGAAGPEGLERPATIAGSLLLVAAHVANWRRRRGRVRA